MAGGVSGGLQGGDVHYNDGEGGGREGGGGLAREGRRGGRRRGEGERGHLQKNFVYTKRRPSKIKKIKKINKKK